MSAHLDSGPICRSLDAFHYMHDLYICAQYALTVAVEFRDSTLCDDMGGGLTTRRGLSHDWARTERSDDEMRIGNNIRHMLAIRFRKERDARSQLSSAQLRPGSGRALAQEDRLWRHSRDTVRLLRSCKFHRWVRTEPTLDRLFMYYVDQQLIAIRRERKARDRKGSEGSRVHCEGASNHSLCV